MACAAVLLPVRRRWLFGPSVGRPKAPVLIPKPAGQPTWFVRASAAGQVESRIDPPHCTPRRQIGVAGATRLAPTVRIGWPPGSAEPTGAQGTTRLLPRRSFRTEATDAAPDEFCLDYSVEPKIGIRRKRRKCLILFGLRDFQRWKMWTGNCCDGTRWGESAQSVENVYPHSPALDALLLAAHCHAAVVLLLSAGVLECWSAEVLKC